ncbi:MAG: ketol-acid reductoisomerase [Planctomycetota bacterium]|jgi:ketol-acid reductoisomerase
MALRIIRGDEAPLDPLRGRTVAVVGYGNQGHAHALNLRDSGLRVVVAARADGDGGRRAAADGFEPLPIEAAVAGADLVIIALPDEVQPAVFPASVAGHLAPGAVVGFLHGYTIRYGLVDPPPGVGVVMIAPKGPGRTLRQRYEEGLGIPCLYARHRDTPAGDAEAVALAWAGGIGCGRAGIVCSTFADETETDLFGEQAVLCGGLTALVHAAFETLVEAGYPPELAYLECCHEVKQVADLVHERGPAGMMRAISSTAEFGAYRVGPRVVDDAVRARLRVILAEVQDGAFAATLRADHEAGFPWFHDRRRAVAEHAIEAPGRAVRALMPWLDGSGP